MAKDPKTSRRTAGGNLMSDRRSRRDRREGLQGAARHWRVSTSIAALLLVTLPWAIGYAADETDNLRAPQGLSASMTNGRIALEWQGVPGASGYTVHYRRPGGSDIGRLPGTAKETRIILKRTSQEYEFAVSAVPPSGPEGIMSAFVTVTSADPREQTTESKSANANGRRGRFGLGVNYPGVGIRYFLSEHYAAEARWQLEDTAFATGLRMYRYFDVSEHIPVFLGLENDYVEFKGDVAHGKGYAGELLAGLEYYPWRRLSIQFDFGPAYILLADHKYHVSRSGFAYVVNFGINYYFIP